MAILVGLIQGPKTFYADSGQYWRLSWTFADHGHSFSLLNFHYGGLRGYAFPLTLYLVHQVGGPLGLGDTTEVVLLNSALIALVAGVLGPELARIAWPRRAWGLAPRLALGAIFLVFWSGFLNFPLSDIPALTAAILAVVAISRAASPGWLLLAGLASAYAVNARPAYLLLVPLIVLALLWTWWRDRRTLLMSPARRALCVIALVGGLAIVSVPQAIVDHHHDGGTNPLPGGNGLAGLQYSEGLRLQRYEGFGPPTGRAIRMEYLDPHTEAIRAELFLGLVADTSNYLEIIADHPVTMAGVFFRHVVNGLDERYSTPYVEHLETDLRKPLRLIGFILVFLALARCVWPRGRRSLGPARWRYPAIVLLSCLTALPSAIEPRFLLPVFLLAAVTVLTPGWPNPLETETFGFRRFRTIAIGCLALAIYLVVVGWVVHGATQNLHLTQLPS